MQPLINGVNLGGWLSHYPAGTGERHDTFITEADIQRIASWGMDHVRLPVDSRTIESADAPGVPNEDGYRHIDNCVRWCEEAGLALVIDMHSVEGYAFQNELEPEAGSYNTLFDNRALQRRFLDLWVTIASRYRGATGPLYYELLNEVILPEPGPWNRLMIRTVDAMREVSPGCAVMVGGNTRHNAVDMHQLSLPDGPNTLFTFHFYEPMLFTHQGAPWIPEVREWGGTPTYPGTFDGLGEFLERAPEHRDRYGAMVGRTLDRSLISELLEPAREIARETGRTMYCGEFGVVQWADADSRRAWVRDVLAELDEAKIGHAMWNYKALSFGLVDMDGNVVDPEMVAIVSGRS